MTVELWFDLLSWGNWHNLTDGRERGGIQQRQLPHLVYG